jgi:hypothetical protein
MGKKQIRFNGYMELCYLHPKYYTPNPEILQLLGIKANEKYVIIRFISWNAAHDFHQHGMSLQFKIQLINELLKHSKIFISSEGPLPDEFQKYKLKVEPGKIHDVLSFASFYIGEGATMASECAMLGTPAIYINSLTAGTLEEQEKYGLIYGFQKTAGVMEKVFELFNKINLREEFQERRQHMLNEKIDVTAFLVWFIENYPASIKVLKTNPEYQYLFK